MIGVVVLVIVLAATLVGGWLWRTREGRVRARSGADLTGVLASVGVRPGGADVTFVQFSSAFCAPCRVTRATLARVADTTPGVAHIEVDAESHLDVVRALSVLSTPTTIVVDGRGRELARFSGRPRLDQVRALVEQRTRPVRSGH